MEFKNEKLKISSNLKEHRMDKFKKKYGEAPRWSKNYFRGSNKPQRRCYTEYEGQGLDFWVAFERPYLDPTTNTVKKTMSYSAYPEVDNFLNKYDTLDEKQKTFYEQIKGECVEMYDIDGSCNTSKTNGKYYSENSDNDIITDFINARIAWGKTTDEKYKKKSDNKEDHV